MERVTNHERPGVYSAYTATAAAQRGNRRGVAAVVAGSQKGTAGTLYALGSYRQAAETFGAEDGLTALVKLLLANGAARVLASFPERSPPIPSQTSARTPSGNVRISTQS